MEIVKIVFIVTALFNILMICTIISPKGGPNNIEFKQYLQIHEINMTTMKSNQLYIAVITNNGESVQTHTRYVNIFKRLQLSLYFDQGVFVSNSKPPKGIGDNRFITVPDELIEANNRKLEISTNKSNMLNHISKQTKLNYSLNDFIHNSTAGWFIYVTTDTGIVVLNYNRFMSELNSKYDPLTQTIFRGMGAQNGPDGGCFPGGPLGMLISRKAAIEMSKIWEKFIFKMDVPEDVYMTKIIHHFHQSMIAFHNDGFSTGIANQDIYKRLKLGMSLKSAKKNDKNFIFIPLCPIELRYLKCSTYRDRLNRLVFYSNLKSFDNIEELIEKKIPDEIKLVHTSYIHNICWEEKIGYLPDPNRQIMAE